MYESILIASATENNSICSMGHPFISNLRRLVPPPTFSLRLSPPESIVFNLVRSLFQSQHAALIYEERVSILRRQEIWL